MLGPGRMVRRSTPSAASGLGPGARRGTPCDAAALQAVRRFTPGAASGLGPGAQRAMPCDAARLEAAVRRATPCDPAGLDTAVRRFTPGAASGLGRGPGLPHHAMRRGWRPRRSDGSAQALRRSLVRVPRWGSGTRARSPLNAGLGSLPGRMAERRPFAEPALARDPSELRHARRRGSRRGPGRPAQACARTWPGAPMRFRHPGPDDAERRLGLTARADGAAARSRRAARASPARRYRAPPWPTCRRRDGR